MVILELEQALTEIVLIPAEQQHLEHLRIEVPEILRAVALAETTEAREVVLEVVQVEAIGAPEAVLEVQEVVLEALAPAAVPGHLDHQEDPHPVVAEEINR